MVEAWSNIAYRSDARGNLPHWRWRHCFYCDRAFKRKSSLMKHLQLHKAAEEESPSPLPQLPPLLPIPALPSQ